MITEISDAHPASNTSLDEVAEVFGLDLDDLRWQDLALCKGMPTNMFYDDYETDDTVANMVDEMCLSCPVMAQCLRWGVENSEWGVWGGVYLVNGRADKNRNAHKTPETWAQIKDRVGE